MRSIKVATVRMVLPAIAGSWLAVSLAASLVVLVIGLGAVLPTIVSTAICYSMASTETPNARLPGLTGRVLTQRHFARQVRRTALLDIGTRIIQSSPKNVKSQPMRLT